MTYLDASDWQELDRLPGAPTCRRWKSMDGHYQINGWKGEPTRYVLIDARKSQGVAAHIVGGYPSAEAARRACA